METTTNDTLSPCKFCGMPPDRWYRKGLYYISCLNFHGDGKPPMLYAGHLVACSRILTEAMTTWQAENKPENNLTK